MATATRRVDVAERAATRTAESALRTAENAARAATRIRGENDRRTMNAT